MTIYRLCISCFIYLLSMGLLEAQNKDSISSFNKGHLVYEEEYYSFKNYKVNSAEGNFDDFVTALLMSSEISTQKNYWLTTINRQLVIEDNLIQARVDIGDSISYESIMMPEHILLFKKGLKISNNIFKWPLYVDRWTINHEIDHGNYYDFEDNFDDGFFYNTFQENLKFDKVSGQKISFSGNRFAKTDRNLFDTDLDIDHANFQNFTFSGNVADTRDMTVMVRNSTISNKTNISGNLFGKKTEVFLQSDSLLNDFFYVNEGEHQSVFFRNCYINAAFNIEKRVRKNTSLKIVFEGCSFGPKTVFSSSNIDTLIFNECLNIASPIQMNFGNNPINLLIANSDVDKFDFVFANNINIIPYGESPEERVSNIFEALLAKYKRESRLDSYRKADIAYHKKMALEEGAWGGIKDFFNRIWWNYSYSRFYVLWWTLCFLILFWVVNMAYWKKMQDAYSILSITKEDHPKLRLGQKMFFAFWFTCFVFFGLRVDFAKLNFKNKAPLFLFFFEYVTGLICMFFILNAIIKF